MIFSNCRQRSMLSRSANRGLLLLITERSTFICSRGQVWCGVRVCVRVCVLVAVGLRSVRGDLRWSHVACRLAVLAQCAHSTLRCSCVHTRMTTRSCTSGGWWHQNGTQQWDAHSWFCAGGRLRPQTPAVSDARSLGRMLLSRRRARGAASKMEGGMEAEPMPGSMLTTVVWQVQSIAALLLSACHVSCPCCRSL